VRLRAWITPVQIAAAGLAVVVLMLLFPISFRAPGDHERTNCGSPLSFNAQNYSRTRGEPHYYQQFVNECVIGRTTRLAQTLGVLAVTGLLVTISAARRQE
jgi:hypothetical protein